jgi:hypothetical protein
MNDQTKSIHVEDVERLNLKVLQQAITLLAYREKAAWDELQKAKTERTEKQQQLVTLTSALAKKYNIDTQTHDINVDTGEIVPKGAMDMNMERLMQALAMGQRAELPPQEL